MPDDYWDHYAAIVQSLGLDEVMEAAHRVVRPEAVVWLVVGCRETIEEPIRRGGFGDIRILDNDGLPLS